MIDAIPATKVAMLASFWPVPPDISLAGAMAVGYPGRVEGTGWVNSCRYFFGLRHLYRPHTEKEGNEENAKYGAINARSIPA